VVEGCGDQNIKSLVVIVGGSNVSQGEASVIINLNHIDEHGLQELLELLMVTAGDQIQNVDNYLVNLRQICRIRPSLSFVLLGSLLPIGAAFRTVILYGAIFIYIAPIPRLASEPVVLVCLWRHDLGPRKSSKTRWPSLRP
jgi:hypothetical protein